MTRPNVSPTLRLRASAGLFGVGVGTWQFTAYPLFVGDLGGVTSWNPASWAVPVLPLALVLAGVAVAPTGGARRAAAAAAVAALAALLWLWPWGAGFYSAGAWGDRFVASLAYPALAAAWITVRGWRPRAYLGLAPLAIVVAAGTVMWPGPAGPIPWGTAWRSNVWPVGPLFVHVSGAGLAAAVAAFGSLSLADRWGGSPAPRVDAKPAAEPSTA